MIAREPVHVTVTPCSGCSLLSTVAGRSSGESRESRLGQLSDTSYARIIHCWVYAPWSPGKPVESKVNMLAESGTVASARESKDGHKVTRPDAPRWPSGGSRGIDGIARGPRRQKCQHDTSGPL